MLSTLKRVSKDGISFVLKIVSVEKSENKILVESKSSGKIKLGNELTKKDEIKSQLKNSIYVIFSTLLRSDD